MALRSERNPDFDARWAAWVARGAAHDLRVRRRLTFAVPVTVMLVVAFTALFFAR